jgi:hypothetical protein
MSKSNRITKLSDFKKKRKDPRQKLVVIVASLVGLVSLFFMTVIGLNVYLHFIREKPSDAGIRYSTPTTSAENELVFIEGQAQFRKNKTVNDIINERLNQDSLTDNVPETITPDNEELAFLLNATTHNQTENIPHNSTDLVTGTEKDIDSKPEYTKTEHIESTLEPSTTKEVVKDTDYQILELKKRLEASQATPQQFQKKGVTNQTTTKEAPIAKTTENKEPYLYRDYSVNDFVPHSNTHVLLPITSTVKAILLTDLNSISPPETIVAKIVDSPKNAKQVIGSTLLGKMSADTVTNRIYINFDKLVLKNNTEIKVHSIAQDENGRDGIKAKVQKNIGNDLIKESIGYGFDILKTSLGGPGAALNSMKEKQTNEINTDIVLTVNKNETLTVFFQSNVEI